VIAVDAGGVKGERITTPRSLHNRYVLHLYGGAYVFGFPALFRDFTWRIADAASARVLCIDYRLAPEHPFPAAIEDATAAYRWLIAECAEPRHVAFLGDSCGGGLVLASMMRLRDEGSPLPPSPLILVAWWETSDLQKRERFEQHIHWAEHHKMLVDGTTRIIEASGHPCGQCKPCCR
jgi:acetyl esterase/lipase